MFLPNVTDIKHWANRRDAQSQMPRLLRLLAHATCSQIERIGFPADESVQLGGWDGIVVVRAGNAFLPDGCSVWELGCDIKPNVKAETEYKKRTDEPLGITRSEATFIFVTPRIWNNKEKWVASKQAEGHWREVRAYDADDLAQWLETAPSVHVWFSRLIDKCPNGAADFVTAWSEWTQATKPPTTQSLVTAGREEASAEIQTWLCDEPSSIAILDGTKKEALAFFLATLDLLPVEERVQYIARGVVVYDIAAWRHLVASAQPLILVPLFDNVEGVGSAAQNGHHILVPCDRKSDPGKNCIRVPRLRYEPAQRALREMGISEVQSRTDATLARRSLTAFRRKIANGAEFHCPEWATPQYAQEILPLLLTGNWDDKNENDQAIIQELANSQYEIVTGKLNRWLNETDPPVRRIGNTWMLVSKEDAWELLFRSISSDTLQRFEAVALKVLATPDPKFELPPAQHFTAAVLGIAPLYSGLLLQGLADTLALLGTRNNEFADGSTGQSWANRIVRKLLEQAVKNWHIWASLSGILPLLAEAAPEVFLEAIIKDAFTEEPFLKPLLVAGEGQDSLFSSRPRTGLLWALETLAWSADYLSRASIALARLATLVPNPKSNFTNWPDSSLLGIFLCWLPQTAASLEQRLTVLDVLRVREPATAWSLMKHLLPEAHAVGSQNHTPEWRDWCPDPRPTVTNGEMWKAIDEISQRLLEDMGQDGKRWCDVVERIQNLAPERCTEFLKRLSSVDPASFIAEDRLSIWSKLREIISRHRQFEAANWALPQTIVNDLEQAYDRLTPEDVILRFAWLFTGWPNLLKVPISNRDDREEILLAERGTAIQSIYASKGLEGLLALTAQSDCPGEIGLLTGKSTPVLEKDAMRIISRQLFCDDTALQSFARGLITAQLQVYGVAWVETQLESDEVKHWSSEQRTQLFICLPFEGTTWDRLERELLEVKAMYWQRVAFGWLIHTAECDRAVENLLSFGRPYEALFLLHRYLRQNDPPPSPLIIPALTSAAQSKPPVNIDVHSFAYAVGDLLDLLVGAEVIDESTLAQLEWEYFPVLHHREARALHRELVRNPQFFVELISYAYEGENEEVRANTERDTLRAGQAYDLLKNRRPLPGMQPDGQLDPEAFLNWMHAAREKAESVDRLKVADMLIGHALAHGPVGSDGVWPDVAIRDLLEEVNSSAMEEGLFSQLYNNRGVVSKNLLDGGSQERTLAERYKGYAAATRDRWPRISSVLKSLSDNYAQEARQSDMQAEFREDTLH